MPLPLRTASLRHPVATLCQRKGQREDLRLEVRGGQCVHACVCLCVCVCVRQRNQELYMRKNMLWVSGCLHVYIFLCLCAENVYLLYMSLCVYTIVHLS